MGEAPRKILVGSRQSIALDTFGGRIHVEWDPAHTHHAGHTRLTITSLHAKQAAIQARADQRGGLLSTLNATAEQWTDAERLRAILTRAFVIFMLTTVAPPTLPTSETAAT